MYVPAAFRNSDRETAYDLIEEIRLGSLVSAGQGIEVSHLPFMIDRGHGPLGRLIGHCARANPQWKCLDGAQEVLVTFLGPNTYVSPGWYGTNPRAPTWLFASVHVRGRPQLTSERELRDMVVRLSNEMDPPSSGWTPDSIGPYIDKLLPGIVGFNIDITDIQTQLRLGQQNAPDDRYRVHRVLSNGDLSQRLVSRLMERFSFTDLPEPVAATNPPGGQAG
ncbi:FMN-binding negative transcriptional regulator [Bradyrhizobium sp.]|uniref:FMN-binding negative transcriptional regulator n=1 Tax=Bradyrhizobium sp. TaxID=376 RepID=UPI0039E265C8